MQIMRKTVRKSGLTAVSLLALGLLSACATSPQSVTSATNPAPISFKAGKVSAPSNQYASASSNIQPTFIPGASGTYTQGYTGQDYSTAPARPAPAAPYTAPAAPVASAPSYTMAETFDQSSIDQELYMHQKVGRPYKIKGKSYTPKHNPSYDETGIASWYGPNFHGKLTANGETYDQNGMTAAHKTLPLNSMVVVTNVETGKSVTLRLNDRGPFVDGRIIDLSQAAAKALGITGLGKVRVQYAGPADPNTKMAQSSDPVVPTPQIIEAPAPAPQMTEVTPAQPKAPSYRPLSVIPHNRAPEATQPQMQPQPQPEPQASGEWQDVSGSIHDAPVQALPQAPRPQIQVPQMISPAPSPQGHSAQSLPPVGVERTAPLVPLARDAKRPAQTFTPPADGGVMTLTISGPIHMASTNGANGAVLTPAFHDGPAAKGPQSAANVHYVQAVTFSSMDRAESVRDALSAAGPVSVMDMQRNGQTLHRVMVGPFNSAQSAEQAKSVVATLGYSDAKVKAVY